MTLIQITRPRRRIFELESEHRFAGAMQQLEYGGRRQKVRLIIRVRGDGETEWREWQELWSGYWKPEWEGGMPMPSKEEGEALLREACRQSGMRYADMKYTAVVFTSGRAPR